MTNTVAALMHRSLMDVFNERHDDRRARVIAEVYAEDVVWHEPDRVIHGREALATRAKELQVEFAGFLFQPAGPVLVNDDLGHLAFHFGPPDQPTAVTGMDIAKCRDGVIVELYTFIGEPG
jgi:SnoaL-like domain